MSVVISEPAIIQSAFPLLGTMLRAPLLSGANTEYDGNSHAEAAELSRAVPLAGRLYPALQTRTAAIMLLHLP